MNNSSSRCPLAVNSSLKIRRLNTNNIECFRITEIVGYGASSIVYSAEDVNTGNSRVRIKEYYPVNISAERDISQCLIIKDVYAFESGKQRFIDAYNMQIGLRNIDSMTNSISNIQGVYEGNNTLYTAMTYNFGKTYDKIADDNLCSIFKIAGAVTKAVGEYHKRGLLHLDIKPSNIYVTPETKESIILFDFDSVIPKQDLQSGAVQSYSYSTYWAAPEQLQHNIRNISEKTDIYAIGAMVFLRIFKRPISPFDRTVNAKFDIDFSSPLFQNVNPKIERAICDFFNKTLSSYPNNRYHSTDELLEKLEELTKLSDPEKMYIVQKSFLICNNFLGRNDELTQINKHFESGDLLFISGIGGIGKSELAKQYSFMNKKKYDVVVLISYNNSLVSSVSDENNVRIANFYHLPNETLLSFFERKMTALQRLCDNNTLLIVDNFDVESDEMLDKILALNCHKIFTTRIDYSNRFPQLSLAEIDYSYIKSLYILNQAFFEGDSDDNALYEIYNMFQGNTLVMEFILKQIKETHTSVEYMLNLLKKESFSKNNNETENTNVYNFFYSAIGFSKLNEQELYILKNLAKATLVGVRADILKEECDLNSYNELNSLVRKGWIKYHSKSERYTMHNVIKEMITHFLISEHQDNIALKSIMSDVDTILSSLQQNQLTAICREVLADRKALGLRGILYFEDKKFESVINKAKNHYLKLKDNEYPIFVYDDSISGNASQGFVMTNFNIHIRYLFLSGKTFSYSEIESLSVIDTSYRKFGGIELMLMCKSGYSDIIYRGRAEYCNYLINFFDSFFRKVIESFSDVLMNKYYRQNELAQDISLYRIKHFVKEKTLSTNLPNSKINSLLNVVNQRLKNGEYELRFSLSSRIVRIYTLQSPKFNRKFNSFYNIGNDEYPFILFDDSDYGNGVRGFLITNKNIYMNRSKKNNKISLNDINYIKFGDIPFGGKNIDLVLNDMKTITLTVGFKVHNIKFAFNLIVLFLDYLNHLLSDE